MTIKTDALLTIPAALLLATATATQLSPDALLRERLLELKGKLQQCGPELLPHEIKAPGFKLRKTVLYARTVLDLLAHRLPPAPAGHSWRALRARLDEGYARIGAFKDLYDAVAPLIGKEEEPDAIGIQDYARAHGLAPLQERQWLRGEVEQRRTGVLQWAQATSFARELEALGSGAGRPPAADAQPPPAPLRSRLYWGAVRSAPMPSLAADDEVRRLAAALLFALANSKLLDRVARIEDLIEDQEDFHDLRKRIRAVLQIRDVPGLDHLLPGDDAGAALAVLKDAVDRCGDLNDLLIRHAQYTARHRAAESELDRHYWRQRASELRHEIDHLWLATRPATTRTHLQPALITTAHAWLEAQTSCGAPQIPRSYSSDGPPRTVSTGHGAVRTTRSAVLPIIKCAKPV